MGSKHKSLTDLFHATLKQHREGRRHTVKCFGRMAKAATDPSLKTALQERHDQGDGEHESIDAVFDALDRKPHDETCDVAQAQVDMARELIDDFEDGPVLDAGLAAAAESMETHASGRLVALRAWAGRLGLEGASSALDRLHAEAVRSAGTFAGLVGQVAATAASPRPEAALTLKQAALLGLR